MVAYGGLVPITLSEMAKLFKNKQQQSQHFLGRLLVGILCTDAKVLEEVIVVSQLEEAPPGCSRSHIFLCNFATSTWSSQQARMWLPHGAWVSIKNPCLSFAADGTACLEILNPATLSIHGIAPPSVGGARASLAQGQASLQRGDFVRAAHLLGMAAAELTGSERATALTGRCGAWLGAGLLDKALRDAIEAQKQPELLPDDRASAAATQAMALMGMQEFAAASACNVQVPSMGKCRRLLEQSRTGILDLESYYLGGETRESSPEVADFVGAVRIGLAPDGKGRGLFATRRVEAGEVLFVCHPLAALHRQDEMPTEQDMVAEVVRSCLASSRNLEQLLSLVHSSMTMVPDLDLFRPNRWLRLAAAARTTDDVDLPACARRTSTNYGYKFERMVGRGRQRRREYLSGLWVLTAFANHSCSPSASQRAVGSASLVRAARELNDGDEVTLPYLDPLAPWEVRSKQTKSRWGFDCSCERCKAESSRAGTGRLKGLGTELDGLLQLLGDGDGDGEEEEDIDRLLVELSKIARSVEAELSRWSSDKERQWTRASFYRAYEAQLLVLHRRHQHRRSSSSCSWIQLMEALHFTAPGHEGLLATLLVFAKRACDDGDEGGLELVHRACESCYGKLRTSVRTELLRQMEEELDID